MAKRIVICCPTSLVNNWDSECIKWLKVTTVYILIKLVRRTLSFEHDGWYKELILGMLNDDNGLGKVKAYV